MDFFVFLLLVAALVQSHEVREEIDGVTEIAISRISPRLKDGVILVTLGSTYSCSTIDDPLCSTLRLCPWTSGVFQGNATHIYFTPYLPRPLTCFGFKKNVTFRVVLELEIPVGKFFMKPLDFVKVRPSNGVALEGFKENFLSVKVENDTPIISVLPEKGEGKMWIKVEFLNANGDSSDLIISLNWIPGNCSTESLQMVELAPKKQPVDYSFKGKLQALRCASAITGQGAVDLGKICFMNIQHHRRYEVSTSSSGKPSNSTDDYEACSGFSLKTPSDEQSVNTVGYPRVPSTSTKLPEYTRTVTEESVVPTSTSGSSEVDFQSTTLKSQETETRSPIVIIPSDKGVEATTQPPLTSTPGIFSTIIGIV